MFSGVSFAPGPPIPNNATVIPFETRTVHATGPAEGVWVHNASAQTVYELGPFGAESFWRIQLDAFESLPSRPTLSAALLWEALGRNGFYLAYYSPPPAPGPDPLSVLYRGRSTLIDGPTQSLLSYRTGGRLTAGNTSNAGSTRSDGAFLKCFNKMTHPRFSNPLPFLSR